MPIAESIRAARSEMAPLIADEKASISGAKGSYTFKYASLPGLLEVVLPALTKNHITLVQDVGSSYQEPKLITVQTKLVQGEEVLASPLLHLWTDGTPRDIAQKLTSARRLQLMALLSLAAQEEEPQPPPEGFRTKGVPAVQKDSARTSWDEQAILRKAVAAAIRIQPPKSEALKQLMQRLKESDKEEAPMATSPAPGKITSMYHFLCNRIDEEAQQNIHGVLLSYLLGRVVTVATPLKAAHEWFVKEVHEGLHKETLAQAYHLATS